jgi:hypothetical protein
MALTREQIRQRYTPKVNLEAPVESQKLRTVAQGATFGFADEIEAFIRSGFSDSTYDEVRDELRAKVTAYKKANPAEALSYELAGALVPSIAAMATGFGAPAGMSSLANIGRSAKILAGESVASAVGYSDKDLTSAQGGMQAAVDTGKGFGFGAIAEAGMRGTGNVLSKLINYARKNIGDGADKVVQAELLRLVNATGLSVEEIISDVANGRIMADNATLTAAIAGMVKEGGQTGKEILAASGARRAGTTQAAESSVRQALAPKVSDPNVIRAYRESEKALKSQERKAYADVYNANEPVTAETQAQMLSIVQRMPEMRDVLNQLYREDETLVPLLKTLDDGSVEFARAPTVRDAEVLRQEIDDLTKKRFIGGEGQLGVVSGKKASDLRQNIDKQSPELAAVRADYFKRMSAKEAFNYGNNALTKDVDLIAVDFDEMGAEQQEAFRQGVVAALKRKARQSGTVIEKLAEEDKQLGALLRVVLPSSSTTDVIPKIVRAAEATSMDKLIQPRAGSITQPLQKEAAARGSFGSMDDVARGIAGDPIALAKILSNSIPSASGLSQEQMVKVAKILYSESPELVEAALTDRTALGKLLQVADTLGRTIGKTAITAAQQQGAQF